MAQPLAIAITNTDPNSCVTVYCDRLGKPWKLPDKGIAFIAVCKSSVLNGTYLGLPVVDGIILEVYNDIKGRPTVGLGHLVLPSDNLKVGDKITVERARQLAKKNLAENESAINRRIKVPLHQHEYDALVSISFNAGPGGEIANLVGRVNSGDYAALPAYIRRYRGNKIEWRRELEAGLFETGNYDATHGKSQQKQRRKGMGNARH